MKTRAKQIRQLRKQKEILAQKIDKLEQAEAALKAQRDSAAPTRTLVKNGVALTPDGEELLRRKNKNEWKDRPSRRARYEQLLTETRAEFFPDTPSPQDILDGRSPKGAWTAKRLAEWGIPWPPPAGWRRELERRWYLVHPFEPDILSYALMTEWREPDPSRVMPERDAWILPWETEKEARERLAREIDSGCI